jgi:hypothetical protein
MLEWFSEFKELQQHLGRAIFYEEDTASHGCLSVSKKRWHYHEETFGNFWLFFSKTIPSGSKQWITKYSHKIREAGAHVVGFIDDITIYKSGMDIDKNTATLSRVLQICHEWAQECHTEFDYGDKLGFLHVYKPKRGRPSKKKTWI